MIRDSISTVYIPPQALLPCLNLSYRILNWACGTGTHHSHGGGFDINPYSRSNAPRFRPESPHTYNQASHSGGYHSDTNITYNSCSIHPRIVGSQQSHSDIPHPNRTQQPQIYRRVSTRDYQPPANKYALDCKRYVGRYIDQCVSFRIPNDCN
jgi:hypothetical protein